MSGRPHGRSPDRAAEIGFDRNLAVAARDRGWARHYFAWLLIKSWDPAGTGFLPEAEVTHRLVQALGQTRKHPKKAARSLVNQLVAHGFVARAPFGNTGATVLRLPSAYRIAHMLGTEPGESLTIPRQECLSRTPARWLYLGIAATRDGTADRPRPTSRRQRRDMSHVGPVTQRKAERMAGVERSQNWVVGSPPPGRPWHALADGRTVYQISVSTQVHPDLDRERLETHLVQRDDRRRYFYSDLEYGEHGVPPGGLVFVGPRATAERPADQPLGATLMSRAHVSLGGVEKPYPHSTRGRWCCYRGSIRHGKWGILPMRLLG